MKGALLLNQQARNRFYRMDYANVIKSMADYHNPFRIIRLCPIQAFVRVILESKWLFEPICQKIVNTVERHDLSS